MHLAFVAFLGWSPVLRSMMGLKRKSDPDTDRIEDGARAIVTEEALTSMVYRTMDRWVDLERVQKPSDIMVPTDLLGDIGHLVAYLEVQDVPLARWHEAIQAGLWVHRQLAQNSGDGVVTVNRAPGSLILKTDGSASVQSRHDGLSD